MAKNLTYNYFVAAELDYWRWSEDGEAIEWLDGRTLCYRNELLHLLKGLARDGLMDLNTVLMVLAACREPLDPLGSDGKNFETLLKGAKKTERERNLAIKDLDSTMKALKIVSDLPKELRSGDRRIFLIQTLYKERPRRYGKRASKEMLGIFESAQLDAMIFRHEHLKDEHGIARFFRPKYNTNLLHVALGELQGMLSRRTTDALEQELRTGFSDVPRPILLPMPPQQETDPDQDLLDQLESDPKTRLLARLTRHMSAALHIPMQFNGSSDQSFGGVSDITNRGSYDRLLLSELANDDHVLMARLANNEAMFLRREELPEQEEKQKVVLVDTCLKMWGNPRVMAMAVALSLSKTYPGTKVIFLGGKTNQEQALDNRASVLKAMTLLDPYLNSYASLEHYLQTTAGTARRQEYIYISEESTLQQTGFLRLQQTLKTPLNYTVALNRNGHLQMFQFQERRRKMISEAQFDFEELMRPQKTNALRPMRIHDSNEVWPVDPHPLYYPMARTVLKKDKAFGHPKLGVLAITQDQRLLYWASEEKAALELATYIEPGEYTYGFDDSYITVCVQQKEREVLIAYSFHRQTGVMTCHQIEDEDLSKHYLFYMLGAFYFYKHPKSYELNVATWQMKEITTTEWVNMRQACPQPHRANTMKRHVNNGYTALLRMKRVFINSLGQLQIDQLALSERYGKLEFVPVHQQGAEYSPPIKEDRIAVQGKDNRNVYCQRFHWKDGSTLLLDSRGMLYLRSSEPSLPEIIIVFIINKPTAAWSADGKVAGSAYFIKEGPAVQMTTDEFYKKHIQQFINALR